MQDVKLFTQLLGIAEPNSRFTVLMERMVIDMQKEIMCISSVAKLAGITYSEAEGIIGRAVNRGLSRRVKRQVFEIGFDEKAHKKGHINDVRKQENADLSRKGNDSLKGTKFAWLYNADAESINSRIERIKNRACGFRNVQNFVNAIYFHLGGLDLYPALPTR